jgi:putative DNA primase/helicase
VERPKASVTPITEARTRQQAQPVLALDDLPARYSHDTMAADFTERHGELRYCAQWGKWIEWTGEGWREDVTASTYHKARLVCREYASLALHNNCTPATVRDIAKAGTATSVERFARADPRHAATGAQWDADAWVMNTPGGLVDLKTGAIRARRIEDYCLKLAGATPRDIPAPHWQAFLNQTTGDDAETIAYLARIVGYAMTGDIREDFLGFIYGPGGNGKSVFLDTVQRILGSYATTAAMDTFTETRNERHTTEIARLVGARLVVAQEVEQGRRWNEQRILSLTGGGKQTARFMRQDDFEFIPQFKLVFAGNHKPALRSVGDNFKRRMHIIPFTRKPAHVDTQLREKLWEERDGIAGWMLRGCLDWLAQGLKPSPAVIKTTREYFETQDILGQFIEEKCESDAVFETRIRVLHPAYAEYCHERREPAMRQGELHDALIARGYSVGGYASKPTIKGLRLSSESTAQSSWTD